MPDATTVPTNGFPAIPSIPATPPAAPPAAPGNGNPIALPGQVPGFVPPGNAPAQPPAQPPAAPPAAPGGVDLAELIRAALAGEAPKPGAAPAQAPAAPPPAQGWQPPNMNTFDVNTITDPGIKSMATVLQVAGKDLDLNRALGRAMSEGDPSLVDFAYIAEKGGAQAQQLAQIAQSIVQAVAAKSESLTREVHALVGGEAVWSQSVAVFNSSAPAELKAVVGQMLNSTNDSHIKAGAKIVAEFGRVSGQIPQGGAPLLQSIAAGGAGSQGLSKDAFQAELRKLNDNDPGYEQAREALFTRRALGKRAGL